MAMREHAEAGPLETHGQATASNVAEVATLRKAEAAGELAGELLRARVRPWPPSAFDPSFNALCELSLRPMRHFCG